jgi:large subunit ribosomal protein L35
MPKMKTHRGAAKRFKRTASGKLRHQKRNRRHILTKKTTKRKRQLRKPNVVTPGQQKNLDQLVPYL